MEEFHVLVSGIVQGVGFRSLVIRLAIKHRINGFVSNLPDGQVEICAQGSDPAIGEFFNDIRGNPGRAVIERFDVKKTACRKLYSSFETR